MHTCIKCVFNPIKGSIHTSVTIDKSITENQSKTLEHLEAGVLVLVTDIGKIYDTGKMY